MTVNVLNADQERRLATHLGLLAADMEDLRAARLRSYGAVHPELASRLDPRVTEVQRLLERLADAAAELPDDDAGEPA